MSSDLEAIRPYVEELLARTADREEPRVFALHHEKPLEGQLGGDGRRVEVRWCPSELAVRETLTVGRGSDPLVLLTPVEELSVDVLARLTIQRLVHERPADAVSHLFGVPDIEPAIPLWMMRALVVAAPPGGYERSGARTLDLDRVWRALLRHGHGVELDKGLAGLLGWAGTRQATDLVALPDERREATVARLDAEIPGAGLLLAAVAAGHGGQALALGLVLRALLDGPEGADRVQARTRLELLLDNTPFDERGARPWALAAEERLAGFDASEDPAATQERHAAERLVDELRAASLAGASVFLTGGLALRLRALAEALDRGSGVDACVGRVAEHSLAGRSGSTQVAELAARLTRWLQTPRDEPADLTVAARQHAEGSSYADLARTVLRQGGREPALDEALRRLVVTADERREAEERQFSELLRAWSIHARTDEELLGVEDLLAKLVAPLAAQHPVLVIVLDGMSHRVGAQLLDDAIADGWTELRRAAHPGRPLALATLPSVTTYSRASLFAGRLTTGLAADEREAFTTHPALRTASGRGEPPILFHKRDLADPHAGLAAEVRAAVASERRIVGAVVNAIDDHLARSDQLSNHWSVHRIVPLRLLLDAARESGRVAVLLSDHGHVIEHGGVQRSHGGQGGERWRLAPPPAGDDEVLVEGPRILAGEGGCVLAADERLHYSPKKHGYHGGATAQEMLAPALVLAPAPVDGIDGWVEAPYDPPAWWSGLAPVAGTPEPQEPTGDRPRAERASPQAGRPEAQLSLLREPSEERVGGPGWIEELLASETLATQRRLAARVPLDDARIAVVLAALDQRGGKLLRPALAQACGLAPARLSGALAALGLLLNVDGYPILSVDDGSDTVELNVALLREQFGLSA